MRISSELQQQMEEAGRLAAELDRRVKRALHRGISRLPRTERAIVKAALAEALETTSGTIARQAQPRDLPWQGRLLAAAKLILPECYREMLDELGDVLDQDWRDRRRTAAEAQAIRAVRHAGRDGADLGVEAFDRTDDEELCSADRSVLRDRIRKLRHSLNQAEAELDALDRVPLKAVGP